MSHIADAVLLSIFEFVHSACVALWDMAPGYRPTGVLWTNHKMNGWVAFGRHQDGLGVLQWIDIIGAVQISRGMSADVLPNVCLAFVDHGMEHGVISCQL